MEKLDTEREKKAKQVKVKVIRERLAQEKETKVNPLAWDRAEKRAWKIKTKQGYLLNPQKPNKKK
ncbi:MAG: hypothetical protein ACKKL4_02045 [Patescibacteria group bacterium]